MNKQYRLKWHKYWIDISVVAFYTHFLSQQYLLELVVFLSGMFLEGRVCIDHLLVHIIHFEVMIFRDLIGLKPNLRDPIPISILCCIFISCYNKANVRKSIFFELLQITKENQHHFAFLQLQDRQNSKAHRSPSR